MRLDKYLKIARVIKRRTIAKDVASFGFVKINGRTAKASSEVKIDDILELTLGDRLFTIKVKSIEPVMKKGQESSYYDIISDVRETKDEN